MSITEFALITLIIQRDIELWYFSKCLEISLRRIEYYSQVSNSSKKLEKERDKHYTYSLIIYGLNEQKQRYLRFYKAIKDNKKEG